MKKLLIIFLLMFATNIYSQIDTSIWSFERNNVDGKYSKIYNKIAFMGADSGTIHIPIQFYNALTSISVSNFPALQDVRKVGTDTSLISALPERLFDSLTAQIGQLITALSPSYNLIKTFACVPDTNGMWNATKDSILMSGCNWFNLSAVTKDSTMWVSFKSEPSFSDIQTVYAGSLFNEKFKSSLVKGDYVYFWHKTSNHIINLYFDN